MTAQKESLDSSRYSCALGGAYAAIANIERAVPILHSGTGCGFAQTFGYAYAAGFQGVGAIAGCNTPSTNLSEKEVIFGGENRLREQINATLDLIDGDLFAVISGCIPSMIGDDVEAVIKEVKKEHNRIPLVSIKAPGFSGSSYTGYELALNALIDQFVRKKRTKKGLVNVLGIVPNQHIFWKGDLAEIKRIFERVGLKANVLFGEGIEAVKKLSSAELTVVLSPWTGIEPAKKPKERFGIPYVVYPRVPVGPRDTTSFLHLVGTSLGFPAGVLNDTIREEEKAAYRQLDIAYDILLFKFPSLPFAVVADSSYALGITRYLANEIGQIPVLVVITDNPPDEHRDAILDGLSKLSSTSPKVIFEADSYNIENILKRENFAILLGSSMEKYLAIDMKAVYLSVSFPAFDRLILDTSYAGYKGGTALIEDIVNLVSGPI
jgi:nitrogenase molybdenum-iron protein beta chain